MDWSEAEGDRVVIEFHDSEVVSIYPEGRTLVIRLSPAWVHRSIGDPGRDEGTLWNQDAILDRLARSTGHLARLIVFGSFVTDKPEPNDVDVFLLMDDPFDAQRVVGEARLIFDHPAA